jgi:hypothetical protein
MNQPPEPPPPDAPPPPGRLWVQLCKALLVLIGIPAGAALLLYGTCALIVR